MTWTANRTAMTAPAGPLTPEQLKARERWQSIWNLPIFVAAVVPLFITSSKTKWVEIAVGVGSWLVFAVDLVTQRRSRARPGRSGRTDD